MKIYKDTDTIHDVLDFLIGLPEQPFLTVWETRTNTLHEGMKYLASSTKILHNTPSDVEAMHGIGDAIIRTLQTRNLDGKELVVDTRLLRELHV